MFRQSLRPKRWGRGGVVVEAGALVALAGAVRTHAGDVLGDTGAGAAAEAAAEAGAGAGVNGAVSTAGKGMSKRSKKDASPQVQQSPFGVHQGRGEDGKAATHAAGDAAAAGEAGADAAGAATVAQGLQQAAADPNTGVAVTSPVPPKQVHADALHSLGPTPAHGTASNPTPTNAAVSGPTLANGTAPSPTPPLLQAVRQPAHATSHHLMTAHPMTAHAMTAHPMTAQPTHTMTAYPVMVQPKHLMTAQPTHPMTAAYQSADASAAHASGVLRHSAPEATHGMGSGLLSRRGSVLSAASAWQQLELLPFCDPATGTEVRMSMGGLGQVCWW